MIARQPKGEEAGSGDGPSVFIVEDDPEFREALKGLFRSVGMRAQVFG